MEYLQIGGIIISSIKDSLFDGNYFNESTYGEINNQMINYPSIKTIQIE